MTFTAPERFNLADWLLDERLREGRGDRVALRLPGRDLTYAEVAATSRRAANVLIGLGLRPEERVFVALPDGADFVTALFGTLRAGGVVVMVNPDLPATALAELLDYLAPRIAVIDGAEAKRWAEAIGAAETSRPTLLTVGDLAPGCPSWDELGRTVSDAFETAPTHRDDAAIWLFSGGTTGRPKAVVQSHRSYAFTTVAYGQGVLGLTEDDVTLSVPKLFFGYAMGSNLFFPFSVGASACLFPERPTPASIAAAIARHRPTVLVNVPTMIGRLLDEPAAGLDLSCLRLATSAGEALPAPLLARWRERFGVELLDGLGTAEQWHVFLSNRPGDVRPGTLGRAVEGFDVRVRDQEGRDLPAGEVGWLWVRGGARAAGYWREHEKTMDTFRGEWVVTGDLVSMDEDGYVTYQGRGDDVLKVAGKWFSPAEVESCLLRHEAVAECAVVGVESPDGLTKPHAWVLPRTRREGLERELSDWVASQLLPYKAPREVHLVAEFPRTHLGKIDRGALRRG